MGLSSILLAMSPWQGDKGAQNFSGMQGQRRFQRWGRLGARRDEEKLEDGLNVSVTDHHQCLFLWPRVHFF